LISGGGYQICISFYGHQLHFLPLSASKEPPNNSFKPTPHRGVNSVLCATLHAVATPPRGGLTQALGGMNLSLRPAESSESQCCGFIRLLPEGGALAIRDVQIVPEFQGSGIGTWAIEQIKQLASVRGYGVVQLRVYPENPAMALYARLGFVVERTEDAVVHMRCYIPPNYSLKRTNQSLRD